MGQIEEPPALTNNAGSVVWLTKPYGQLYGESGSLTISNPATTGIAYRCAAMNWSAGSDVTDEPGILAFIQMLGLADDSARRVQLSSV